MRILLLDIETAPNLAYCWGLWKQNIGTHMLIEGGYVLSWAAKWYGEDEIFFSSLGETGPVTMIKEIHKLLHEADAVVHYNGAEFDIPTLNQEFVLKGLTPPAPYKQIDLLKTVRSQFRFPSNKLEYVVDALNIGKKGNSGGFNTWIGCMHGEQKSWDKLKTYNIQDITLLEALYERLRPWVRGHPNATIHGFTGCPTCSSTNYQRRGYAYTTAYRFPRYRCRDCGKWFRGNRSDGPKPDEKFLGL